MRDWRKDEPGFPLGALKIVILALAVVLLLAVWLPAGQMALSIGLASGTLRTEFHDGRLFHSSPASTVPLTWTELLPEGLPPSNSTTTPVLVYDPLTQQTLDFASTFQNGLTSVWGFDAGVWTNVSPPGNLTHQYLTEFSATFDAADGYLLLFGYVGYNDQTSAEAQTWTYSAGTWTQLHPSTEPRGESMAGVTYDPVDSSAILLTTLYTVANSLTWAFHGGNWTQLETSSSPPALYGSTMAFDNSSADQEVVLFADGIQSGGPTKGFWNQTWVYRGNQWLNVTGMSGPAPAAGEGAMTYDSSEQEMLLVDSGYFANTSPARTWEFTNGRWAYLNSPSITPFLGNGGSNFAYDAHDGYALLVGTYSSSYSGNFTTQTWKFDRTDIGPPPSPVLNVTPRNLTEGATVHITASATGGFGALAFRVGINLPGLSENERRTGSWNFTTTGSGEGFVFFIVTDQSGRLVELFTTVNITSPASPSTNGLVYVLVAGVLVAACVVGAVILVRRRRRRPPPASVESSAPSPGGQSQ